MAGSFQRRRDWRARLTDYLSRVARQRFRPGRHDCALFAAGAVEAMTGADPAAMWRGQYDTIEAGRAALAAEGWADHIAVAAALFPAVAPALAGVGDLAVMPADYGERALGIVQGPGVYCLRPSGLVLADRLHMLEAFTI